MADHNCRITWVYNKYSGRSKTKRAFLFGKSLADGTTAQLYADNNYRLHQHF